MFTNNIILKRWKLKIYSRKAEYGILFSLVFEPDELFLYMW